MVPLRLRVCIYDAVPLDDPPHNLLPCDACASRVLPRGFAARSFSTYAPSSPPCRQSNTLAIAQHRPRAFSEGEYSEIAVDQWVGNLLNTENQAVLPEVSKYAKKERFSSPLRLASLLKTIKARIEVENGKNGINPRKAGRP